MTRTMPSSGSTSTSQMWVPKPPSAPSVLSCTPAPIGPPICGALAASWAGVGARRMRGAVFPFHGLGIDLPDFCGALAQSGDDLVGGLRHHHCGSKQHAAAAGEIRKADGRGVSDQHRYPAVVDAEQLRTDVGD